MSSCFSETLSLSGEEPFALQEHLQTMLKTKLNVLTLRKEPLPTVIFHEPEAIELCSTTPHTKNRTHTGYKVTYLGKVTISGTHFLSGCTESAVVGLWDTKRTSVAHDDSITSSNGILEIRPFQVARIAYCTADHNVSPNVFAWIYRQINDDLTFQMDCHAVECESKLEAKKLAHSMMEAFKKTFHSMHSDGRIHKSSSSDEFPEEASTPDDG
uniref:Phosphotyrosine interaction domain containing 1 n=1 Tax=Cyprinus carpio carpio TaxID=630221 RepID=A0A9J7X4E9_CYPCA